MSAFIGVRIAGELITSQYTPFPSDIIDFDTAVGSDTPIHTPLSSASIQSQLVRFGRDPRRVILYGGAGVEPIAACKRGSVDILPGDQRAVDASSVRRAFIACLACVEAHCDALTTLDGLAG